MIPTMKIDWTGAGTNWTICTPKNWKQFQFEGVFAAYTEAGEFVSMHPSVQLKTVELEFWGADAIQFNQYRINGTTGDVGIETGLPFQVWDQSTLIFSGVVDGAHAKYEPDRVVATFRQTISLDMFYNILGSINFALLREYTVLSGLSADGRAMAAGQLLMGRPGYDNCVYQYKITAYKVIHANSLPHAISTLLHMIQMINTLWNAIYSLGQAIGNAASLVAGAFTIAAGLLDLVVIIAQVVNLVVIIAEIIGNIELMMNQFGLIGKYKYCMVDTDIIYSILTYINQQNGNANFSFSSTIYGVGGRGYFDDPLLPGSYPYCNRPLGATTNLTQAVTSMPRKGLLFNQSVNPSINNFVNGLEHPLGDDTKPGTLGPPYGCPDGNCKTWWLENMKFYNAVTKLIPGATNDLQMEEYHYWSEQTPIDVVLDDTDKPNIGTFTLPQPDETNYTESTFDYYLSFKLDPKDDTTDQFYNGTTCNVLIQPKIINSYLNIINPGGKIHELPSALAKPYYVLNVLDQALNAVYGFVNSVFNILNALTFNALSLPNFPSIPAYPYLQLSGDTFTVPKKFIGYSYGGPPVLINNNPDDQGFYSTAQPGTITPLLTCWQPSGNSGTPGVTPGISGYLDPNGSPADLYENYMSADCLMRLFHSKTWICPASNGYQGGNQYNRYKNKQVKMSSASFLSVLLQGNVIYWIDGFTPCIIEKIAWHMYDEIAIVDYRILSTYTTNLTRKISIDGTNT